MNRRTFIISSIAAVPFVGYGSEKLLSVAVIGCGERATLLIPMILALNNLCKITAICDVNVKFLQRAKQMIGDCATYADYNLLLEKETVDCVFILVPDHNHFEIAMKTAQLKKHMYLEKPFTLSLNEDATLRDAVKKSGSVFQFGTWQRSGRLFKVATDIVKSGAIGDVNHIDVWCPGNNPFCSTELTPVPPELDYKRWSGNAQILPYTRYRADGDWGTKTWWFTSAYCLGFIATWGVHVLDIALMGCPQLFNGQIEATGKGIYCKDNPVCDTACLWNVAFIFKSAKTTLKFVGMPNGNQICQPIGSDFSDEYKIQFAQKYSRKDDHGIAFNGEKGWVFISRNGIKSSDDSVVDQWLDAYSENLHNSSNHIKNFIDAVLGNEKPASNIDSAYQSDVLCHIADKSLKQGKFSLTV